MVFPAPNTQGKKMSIIPNFYFLLFLSVSKPPNPVVTRFPSYQMPSCICAFFLILYLQRILLLSRTIMPLINLPNAGHLSEQLPVAFTSSFWMRS